MRVSAEAFFLVNCAMNFAVLAAAARGMLFVRWARLLTASALGAAFALASERLGLPGWADAPAVLGALAVAFPLERRGAPGVIVRALTAAVVTGRVAGAASRAFGPAALTLLVGAAAGCACACASFRAFRSFPAYVRLRVSAGGHTRDFPALLDTGNTVTEAMSGLAVLIADRRVLGEIGERPAERYVSYGAVGSTGEIGCVRPERMEYHNGRKWVRAPDMWLGIYPGVLRGGTHALAPGALLTRLGRR